MKVSKVQIHPITIRFSESFETSYGPQSEQKSVLIKLETDEGITGWGEAAPLEEFTGENQDKVVRIFKEKLSGEVLNENPLNIRHILQKMGKIEDYNSAKSAVDSALHDILGKKLRQPVYRVIGGLCREKIPLCEVFGIEPPERLIQKAVACVENGIKALKIKIGTDPVADALRIKLVRDALKGIELRADANGGYTLKRALDAVKRMEKYDLAYMEQPIPPGDLEALIKLKESTSIQIAVDESLYTFADAIEIVENEAADVFIIKLIKCGGIFNAKLITEIAEEANIPCVLVSPFETCVGLAANLHVALSSPSVKLPCELTMNTTYLDKYAEGLRTEKGFMLPPEEPGLGIKVHLK